MSANTEVRHSFSLHVMLCNLFLASYSVDFHNTQSLPFRNKNWQLWKKCFSRAAALPLWLCVPVLMTRGLWRVQRAQSWSASIPFCCCPNLGHNGVQVVISQQGHLPRWWPCCLCSAHPGVGASPPALRANFSLIFDLLTPWDLWKGHWKTIGSVILT